MSSNLLGNLNENITIPERAKFSDAFLTLQPMTLHQSDTTGNNIAEWCMSSYFFAIDVGAILEKNSLFSWAYNLPQYEEGKIAPDKIGYYTNILLQHMNASCRIKNFRIKRRAVQRRKLNNDYAKEQWEEVLGEDPDCHTDGVMVIEENWSGGMGGGQMIKTVTTEEGSISHQKISPLLGPPSTSPSAESCSDFSLSTTKEMVCQWDEFDGVSWAGVVRKQVDSLHLKGNVVQNSWARERSKMLFVEGQDRRIPRSGKKRFQYGIEFEVKDGFVNTLKAALGEPANPAFEVPPIGGLSFANNFQPLITGKNNSLDKIKKDLDQGLVNVGYGAYEAPIVGYSNNNFVRTAPVVDPVTQAFTNDYLNSIDTDYSNNKDAIESGLWLAVKSYFGILRLFSLIPSYNFLSEGNDWKIDYGLKDIDESVHIFSTYQSISPLHGGSARGFMLFHDMYNDMIYMIRNLLKHTGSTSHSFLMGATGENSNPDVATTDPGTHKPAINDNIKVDHWFQQTMLSPAYGLSGYSYLPEKTGFMAMFNVMGAGHISLDDFDEMVDVECKKYFQDPAINLPLIPPNSDKEKHVDFGMTSDTKHGYLTLKNAYINGVKKDLDITPPTGISQTVENITNELDQSQVVYANTLLQILARAELNKGTYPQVTVDEGKAYDGTFSKEDQILLSKIMLGRSCVVNPQLSDTYMKGDGVFNLAKISYTDLYTTVYDHKPLDPDEAYPDDYYGHFAPGKYGNNGTDYTVYEHEKLRLHVHFLMTLVANDEFDIFNNFNARDWEINPTAAGDLDAGFLNEILKKEKPKFELRKLPNPIKYLFEAVGLYRHAMNIGLSGELASAYFTENTINEHFVSKVLQNYFLSLPDNPGGLNTKESLATLYFNFFNIGRIEYLSGFESMPGGGIKKYSLKSPNWRPLIAYQSTTQTEPDALNHIRGTGKKLLCRVKPWDGFAGELGQVMNLRQKYLSMPILGQYFYITD